MFKKKQTRRRFTPEFKAETAKLVKQGDHSFQQFEFQDEKSWVESGDSESQYELAMMYGNGLGVPRDYVQAHTWSAVASANGQEAGAGAQSLFAKHMTADQIAEAESLAREHLEKYR
jgi:TPR repeat protein